MIIFIVMIFFEFFDTRFPPNVIVLLQQCNSFFSSILLFQLYLNFVRIWPWTNKGASRRRPDNKALITFSCNCFEARMYWNKVLLGQVCRSLLVQPSIPCPGKSGHRWRMPSPGAPRVRTKVFFKRILWFERLQLAYGSTACKERN